MKYLIEQVVECSKLKFGDVLGCLYSPYNGLFEQSFHNIQSDLYASSSFVYDLGCNLLPTNMSISPNQSSLPNRIDIHTILFNNRDIVYKINELMGQYHINSTLYQHSLPNKDTNPNLKRFSNNFISSVVKKILVPNELVAQEWGLEEGSYVKIPYGFEICKNRVILSDVMVGGSIIDLELIKVCRSLTHKFMLVANGVDSAKPYSGYGELCDNFLVSKIALLNEHSLVSPFHTLISMSCGCIPIVNNTRWTSSIIKQGYNGFIYNDRSEIKPILRSLLNNDKKRAKMQENMYSYIDKNWNMREFEINMYGHLYNTAKKAFIL